MARIGLNAHLLSYASSYRSAGVSRYIANLLAHLPEVDPASEYVAYLGDARIAAPGWERRLSRWPTQRPPARILWEQTVQPLAARRDRLALLHAPVYVGPWLSPCPLVVTVHDLSFFLYPELFKRGNRTYLQTLTRRTVVQAERIIADSESTRRDILSVLGTPADRVVVVPAGVGAEMRPDADPDALRALRARRGLPERLVLFVGTLEPRKNLPRLLEAWSLLQQRGCAHTLVIAGGKGWYYADIEATVQRLHLAESVLFPGYVPDEELPLWYNAAELFVYPSLYEGFGLPPLEAMACGTPVITSNAASLPEVVGEAAVIVDALDADALATAMATLLGDAELRSRLRAAGLARARGFSWRATAYGTSAVYHAILGG
jgi:glycosyltransferase involved in cell wall biosynthesis